MSVGDVLDTVGSFIDGISGDDEEEGKNESLFDVYLSLWHRMDIVVKVLARETSRRDEAVKFVIAFFKNTEDFSKLEKIVKAGESSITDGPTIVMPAQTLEPPLEQIVEGS